jgi:2-keto-3-deoxy-L-rhamnonate aldolase RhmA
MTCALARLRDGESVYGMLQILQEAAITELAVWCGYDFVLLDCEHGVLDEAQQLGSLRSVTASDAFSLVRLRSRDESAVTRYIEFGADGVIVPDVNTRAQAENLVLAVARSRTGVSRAERYGLEIDHRPATTPLLLVMMETAQSIEQAESILDVPGIDGAIVGPRDLSRNLGIPNDFAAPAYVAALDRVETAARSHQKLLGTRPNPAFPASVLIQRGYRLIILAADVALVRTVFASALESQRLSIRAEPGLTL